MPRVLSHPLKVEHTDLPVPVDRESSVVRQVPEKCIVTIVLRVFMVLYPFGFVNTKISKTVRVKRIIGWTVSLCVPI